MSHRARVWVALWAVYIIWGSTYLGIAVADDGFPPLLAASTRYVAAGLIMAAIVVRRGGTMRMSRRSFASCALVGLLLPGANGLLFVAEQNVPVGLASLLIAAVPLWVVVLRLGLRERLRPPLVAGVIFGFAGVAVLLHPEGGATRFGIALCLLASLMWSLGSVASARLEMPANAFAATAWEMIIGGGVMLPFGLARLGSATPTVTSTLAWVYLVTFGSLVGYTAYTWLLANAPLGTVSTYAYVNPVVAILLGVLLRGEHLSWRTLIGAAIVVSAVAVVVARSPPAATLREEGVR